MCHDVRGNGAGRVSQERRVRDTFSHEWSYEHPMPHFKKQNNIGERKGGWGKIRVGD